MLRVAEHYAATDTGLQRRANEDSLLARSPLFVVADGMGGAQAGEVASRLAVEAFEERTRDFSDPAAALVAYAHEANARIYELARNDAAHAGMGTTVTAVYVGEHEVTVAHVGDSRAYCLRDGELMRLTDDHSLVDELIRQGRLTPEEAEDHPQRSIITRALGPEASVEVDTRSFKAQAGDVYMLCSDGLTSMVGDHDLEAVMVAHARLTDVGEALIMAANAAGGRDNITVLLLRLEEVGARGAAVEPTTVVGLTPAASARRGSPPAVAAELTAGGVAGASRAVSNGHGELSGRAGGTRRRMPRPADGVSAQAPRRRRRRRRLVVPAVLLGFLAVIAATAYLTLQSVYFIGTNGNGLVTIYEGVPYQLFGKVDLYKIEYVSGVGASTLTPARRHTLLNQALRSEADAGELVRKLELGQIAGG